MIEKGLMAPKPDTTIMRPQLFPKETVLFPDTYELI